jgi:hypothetical protein
MITNKLYVEYFPSTGEIELLVENSKAFEIIPIESDKKVVREVSYLYSSFFDYIGEELFKSFIYKLSVNLQMRNAVKYDKEEDTFYLDEDFIKKYLASSRNLIELEIESYRSFLGATDWYIVRNLETGAEIPELIREQRAEKRTQISLLNEKLNELPEEVETVAQGNLPESEMANKENNEEKK